MFETAEKALEMDVDNGHSLEVGMEVTSEVSNWADGDIELEAAGARETMDTDFSDSLDSRVGYVVQNITKEDQTEVVMDLEGLDLETGHGLRVGNEVENDQEECIISVHYTGNCAEYR